jgi:hypothetical protein
VIPLEESPEHLKAKNLFEKPLRDLGYKTWQEYEFPIIGFFGYQWKSITRIIKDIVFLRGSRYIGKNGDVATYIHNIDIYAEKMNQLGLRRKIAIEIDGESHEALKQQRNDRVFEMLWDMWMEEPKDLFRVKKKHVLAMPPELMHKFVEFVLKGEYTELLNSQKDHDILIEQIILLL